MKVYDKHNIPPTCFGHLCGHSQGGALQRMNASDITKVCEPLHRCKILSFKNTWFKIHISFKIQIRNCV